MTTLPRTLFMGNGPTAVAWYRMALPAMALGQDWVGIAGGNPSVGAFSTGLTAKPLTAEDIYGYEVVVVQQAHSRIWLDVIGRMRANGTTVLYEIDDYVQSVRKLRDHDFSGSFDRKVVDEFEKAMRACDGIICSTEFLARRYRQFNRTWVARNGIDMGRYDLGRSAREQVRIGWAGGTGHREALARWTPGIVSTLREFPDAGFASIGVRASRALRSEFPDRVTEIPFGRIEAYPAAMRNFDIALAPSTGSNFYRGKSDLRWLEASALGMPLIADPEIYPEIEHGVTGLHAATPEEAHEHMRALVADPDLRDRIGFAARDYVRQHRSWKVAAGAWSDILGEVAGNRAAAGTELKASEPSPVATAVATDALTETR